MGENICKSYIWEVANIKNIQVYLRDTAGSFPCHHNKANTALKWVTFI